jgi:glucosamine--fructose-6-phosphate aminotransferase (isomerizing)
VVVISQSGETADTLAALKHAQSWATRTRWPSATWRRARWCANRAAVPHARRHRDRRGVDQGVHHAARRAVRADATLGKLRGHVDAAQEAQFLKQLRHLPAALNSVLALEPQIIAWSEEFARKENALFLGRGLHYRSRSKARSSSRKSRTSTPKPIRPANSSTARWRWSRKRCRWSRSRRTTRCSS